MLQCGRIDVSQGIDTNKSNTWFVIIGILKIWL